MSDFTVRTVSVSLTPLIKGSFYSPLGSICVTNGGESIKWLKRGQCGICLPAFISLLRRTLKRSKGGRRKTAAGSEVSCHRGFIVVSVRVGAARWLIEENIDLSCVVAAAVASAAVVLLLLLLLPWPLLLLLLLLCCWHPSAVP